MEISEDVKRAYSAFHEVIKAPKIRVPYELTKLLADFARDALAEAMRAEFYREHDETWMANMFRRPAPQLAKARVASRRARSLDGGGPGR